MPLLLVAITVLAYSRAAYLGFIWDDDYYVVSNTTLRSLGGLWRIWTEFGATPQYYPLVHTTFWLEYHLWGLAPAGYHLVNVALHITGVFLLWRILVLLRVPAAWLGAALFAVHPVMVESVAWVTERKNVLCGVFYFASALFYLRWLNFGDEESRASRPRALYAWSLGWYLLALLSKTVACTLPAALLLIQWWKNDGRLKAKNFLPLAPFVIAGGALGWVTAWMERHHVGASGSGFSLTFVDRILIAGRDLWFYAAKLLWPAKLTFMYPKWQPDPSAIAQWLFPVAAAGVVLGLWLARKKIGRGPITACLYFVITLSPALGFVDVFPFRYSYVADHFQYLACLGLLVPAGAILRRAPATLTGAILIMLAFLTWRQTAPYRNLETLWRDTISKNPESWMAHSNLAVTVLAQGNASEALSHLETANALRPHQFEIESTMGSVLLNLGRIDDALPYLERAAGVGAIDAPVHYNLATAYYKKERFTEALDELEKCLRFDPKYVAAYSERGAILLYQGRTDDALTNLQRAVALEPSYPPARFNLANTLLQLGKRREALEQLEQALAINPNNPEAQKNMAWVLATSSDDSIRNGARAVELAESARRLTQGRDTIVLITLAAAYAEAGRFSDAVATAETALAEANAAGNSSLAQGIQGYITLYQYRQPFRDTR